MPAKDLGTKYTCFKCNTKFYDMNKAAPVCPKCGADQRESPAVKGPPPAERRPRAAARPVAPEVEEVETVEAAVDDEDLEADEEAEDVEEDEP
ncbi:TIGR02300 family protein [Anaeromyxobacter oryzae]|uniref:TIGR02300 family protein n=1 Tax=Anaeromyxobacter oryzae TaxID=2918170 RepID=A0ABM7WYK1_9BACT|nr:TIGR02300 family protein [Anaeromyxobacter oryzae]BDG04602.1 hypothetical protein AMOR_35980 [Anaeromyxobacter oryzae]